MLTFIPYLISHQINFTPYLSIDDIYHKAFIEIDEKGGEAAAATAAVMEDGNGSDIAPMLNMYYFTVDLPFLFMIIEKSTDAAIFMARATDL